MQHPPEKITTPDTLDRILSGAALILFAAACIALIKGHADWPKLPLFLWLHLATVGIALVLTPVMLLRRRGDKRHRVLGYIWIVAMFVTALVSLNLKYINHGNFSPIHILSVFTMTQAPLAVWHARKHALARHRRAVRGMVIGGLVIAGAFTFPFGRMLGVWLFS
jgi:uncharacterized membrane protein